VTTEEWLTVLRKRSHELANFMQQQDSRLVRFDERQSQQTQRLKRLEDLIPVVEELRHQARVLKWMLATLTAVSVGLLVKLI